MSLTIRPWSKGAKVFFNGKLVDPHQYQSVPLPLNAPHELIVELPGFKKYVKEFTVTSAEVASKKAYSIEIQAEPEIYGRLTLKTTPTSDVIYINGEEWGKRTPVQEEKLPLGTYMIRAVNEILQMEKTFSVTILENKSVTIDERLEIKK
ncbi:MAG: PEGA domain-containing protein [Bdellovibrio sp.]|nr:PEGA domain-containing protein [Bdellovibrio sp.]